MKTKKNNTIDSMVGFQEQDNLTAVIDEKSTLCIKLGRATNYRYNKEFPQHPYCVCKLNCVYKNVIGVRVYCEYESKKYEAERQ